MKTYRGLYNLYTDLRFRIHDIAFDNWALIEQLKRMDYDSEAALITQVGLHQTLLKMSATAQWYYLLAHDTTDRIGGIKRTLKIRS